MSSPICSISGNGTTANNRLHIITTCNLLFNQHFRKQRNGLVQTEEQYVFIHDALVEAIEAGETHITKSCLPKYIHSLQCIDVTDEKPNPCKVLEKQYKVEL